MTQINTETINYDGPVLPTAEANRAWVIAQKYGKPLTNLVEVLSVLESSDEPSVAR